MRYISLLLAIQKFYIRALQTAVQRNRKPHETNILGYEPGRSTAGITATLRQILGKAAELGVEASVASADVEGAFACIKHVDVERALLRKGVHPGSVCALVRESCDLKGRINSPGAPMSSPFPYACGSQQGSVEGPDMWNQVLDNALREPAARWESAKIGFKLATDYRRLWEKSRRSLTREDMNGTEDLVLYHLCWADDLYAMGGSIEHLIRILTDTTNAVEDLDMKWKEKSLKIVAGPCTKHKPGQTVEIVSKRGKRFVWHVTEGMVALGTWLDDRQDLEGDLHGSLRRNPCSEIPRSRSRTHRCILDTFFESQTRSLTRMPTGEWTMEVQVLERNGNNEITKTNLEQRNSSFSRWMVPGEEMVLERQRGFLWIRNTNGEFEKISHGGKVLRDKNG